MSYYVHLSNYIKINQWVIFCLLYKI